VLIVRHTELTRATPFAVAVPLDTTVSSKQFHRLSKKFKYTASEAVSR
jgi:hypothetical protein